MVRICSFLLAAFATSATADIRGTIRVIDGDTIEVADVTVRLHGIDAPEVDQMCETRTGQPFPCGVFVSEQVHARYDGKRTNCTVVTTDRYGRYVAKCMVNGRDIGEDIVLEGWAEAYRRYSMDYDLAEKSAQVRGVGLWAGSMQSPAEFRAGQAAAQGGTAPDQGCIIKGNISNSGHIYHMPHNRDYAATRINEARGERWFCTEAEARAAGWRPARN